MREKVPFQLVPELGGTVPSTALEPEASQGDWRQGLPVLANQVVTLRELQPSDAAPLFAMLSTDEVRRYMTPPPSDIAGFERFIAWARAERAAGRYLCYAVLPAGYDTPVGIFQVRQLDPAFTMGEWGAALGCEFWGSGLFEASARLVMDFLFEVLGIHRLEARAAVQNGRANGAARKIGAVPEGVARRGLNCRGQYHDQLMWSILAEDWLQSKQEQRPIVH
jgi:[ribosomal protein S5]-alanine N-acetyltransferase